MRSSASKRAPENASVRFGLSATAHGESPWSIATTTARPSTSAQTPSAKHSSGSALTRRAASVVGVGEQGRSRYQRRFP